MEDQNITTYRHALQQLWDVQAAMPAECNPVYPEWLVNWNAQQAATETTRDDIIAANGDNGSKIVVDIILTEHKVWEAKQS